jgi:hypothetical protein
MDNVYNVNDFIKKFKKDFFYWLSIIVVSAMILYIVVNVLLYNENVNEGNYRVIDAAVINTVEIENVSREDKWAYNVSSVDVLSLLVSCQDVSKIKSVYIRNFSSDLPRNIVLSQKKYNTVINANTEEVLTLNSTSIDGNNILYELEFKDVNVLKNFVVPKEEKEVTLDGTIYSLAGISIYDLTYTASFEFVIEETTGRKNIMKYEITMPNSELITEGTYISNLDVSNFVFKILSWKNFFRYI